MALPEAKVTSRLTMDEFLEFERVAEERHHYLDGEIFLVAGESLNHSTICANLMGEIVNQLKGKPCRAISPNMKIRSGLYTVGQRTTKGLFSYADLSVVCGEPQFHDDQRDVLLNPQVIFEVISPSTDAFDKVLNFSRYRAGLDSFTEYILVAQDEPLVEHYVRQPDDKWLMRDLRQPDDVLRLETVDCFLELKDIYARVVFPAPDIESESETGS